MREIEEALLDGRVDLAVHSAKDVPGRLRDGLAIVGVPEREDPLDALCGAASLDELAEGAVVGTASVRRRAQLLALRPGSGGARAARQRGHASATSWARGRSTRSCSRAPGSPGSGGRTRARRSPRLVPAPGQGCLALEARAGDEPRRRGGRSAHRQAALACLTAERALVSASRRPATRPWARWPSCAAARSSLTAFAGLPDGSHWIRDALAGDPADPAGLGREVGRADASGGRARAARRGRAELAADVAWFCVGKRSRARRHGRGASGIVYLVGAGSGRPRPDDAPLARADRRRPTRSSTTA